MTLWTQNGGENLYFQTYDYPDGNPQGWNEIWHSGNFNPSSYLRSDTNDTYSGGLLRLYTQAGVTIQNSPASTTQFDTLQIYQQTAGADALITFHVGGDYAVHFRLDGSKNDLVVGGWSKGAVSYKLWHEGNDGTGSGLDADKLQGLVPSYAASADSHIIRTDQYGYAYIRWINTTSGSVGNVQPYYIYCNSTGSTDQFIRKIPFTYLADRINAYGSAKNSHTHSYLPLSGGTMSGTLNMANCDITGVNHLKINDRGEGIYFYDSVGSHEFRQDDDNKYNLEALFYNATYKIQMGDAYDNYSECSIFPSTDGKGNCGTPLKTWSQCVRLVGTTGSSRDRKELIRLYDTERAYEIVKDTLIYSFRYKTEHDPKEVAKMEALGREVHDINWFNLGVMADQAPLEILNSYTSDDTHISIDNAVFLTMAALKGAMNKIEELEQKVEELQHGIA